MLLECRLFGQLVESPLHWQLSSVHPPSAAWSANCLLHGVVLHRLTSRCSIMEFFGRKHVPFNKIAGLHRRSLVTNRVPGKTYSSNECLIEASPLYWQWVCSLDFCLCVVLRSGHRDDVALCNEVRKLACRPLVHDWSQVQSWRILVEAAQPDQSFRSIRTRHSWRWIDQISVLSSLPELQVSRQVNESP